jgi:hypothetical protein
MPFNGFQPRANLTGYTSIPNEFFDQVLPNVETIGELKILLALFRKTYGWVSHIEDGTPVYKQEDSISYSQFQDTTGLSLGSIASGITKATEKGYITCIRVGGLGKGSSTYRIRQLGEPITPHEDIPENPPENAPQRIKEIPEVNYTPPVEITDEDEAEAEKEGVLAELLGETPQEKPPKKKKYNNFNSKAITSWNCNDLLSYFANRYKTFVGIAYPMITNKDRHLAKLLLATPDLNTLDIVKAIDYYLRNFKTIHGLPIGYPSWSVFYGWKNTIFPAALVGEDKAATGKTNTSIREYQEPTEVTNPQWVPNSWD